MNKILSLLLLVSVAAVGCTSPIRGGSARPMDPRINIAPDVAGSVQLEEVRINSAVINGSTPGSPLVYLRLRNLRSSETPFQYQIAWLDSHGGEIQSTLSTWSRDVLPPYSIKQVYAVAPSDDASDFLIQIRADR